MTSIKAVGTAVPDLRYTADEVRGIGAQWLRDTPEKIELFSRFLNASRAEHRYYSIPSEQILDLRGLERRNHLFEELAPALGEQAIRSALSQSGIEPAAVESMIFTSCSCPSIPAVDGLLIDRLGFRRTIQRLPIYQHGCAGGVIGLQFGKRLGAGGGIVAVTSVELCSLVFQPRNTTPAQLVGAALFSDGAACAILSPEEKGLCIRGSESFLVPHTRHLMGYDIFDDGFHLRLDRDLPQALAETAPRRVRDFLGRFNLQTNDVRHWLFHPGGVKILDFLEEILEIETAQAHWSRDVLSQIGNLSSASVLFVLKAFLESGVARAGDKVVMLGVGPGLTLELILFEWVG